MALGYLESIEMKGMAADSNVVVDNDMKLVLLLNYAACALKLRDYPAAVKYTTMVLEADPRNVKALFRRGQVGVACPFSHFDLPPPSLLRWAVHNPAP